MPCRRKGSKGRGGGGGVGGWRMEEEKELVEKRFTLVNDYIDPISFKNICERSYRINQHSTYRI